MAASGNHDSGKNLKFDFFKRNFDNPLIIQTNADIWINFYTFSIGPALFIQYDPFAIVYKQAPLEHLNA